MPRYTHVYFAFIIDKVWPPACDQFTIFFYFDLFNYYSKNEPDETFFSNLALLSHVNPSGVTYEGVIPI
jgi:hypothetical protein